MSAGEMVAPLTPAQTPKSPPSPLCAVCGECIRGSPAVRLGTERLLACHRCGSWTYWPRRNASEQAELHDSAAYFEHPYLEARRGAVKIETPARRFAIAALRRCMLLERLRGARLLDVGCDIGAFAGWAAQAFGVIPLGIDVARRAVDEARRCGIDAYHTDLEHAPPDLSNLPLITAIDVIEHVSDPRAFLQALRDRLSPGGLAYLQTPNIRSVIYWLGCMLSRMSAGWSSGVVTRIFPAEHAQYFNRESLRVAAGQAGLEIPYLSTRVLQGKEIAASWPVRLLMIALQILDRLSGREILICAVLQRPASKTGTDS